MVSELFPFNDVTLSPKKPQETMVRPSSMGKLKQETGWMNQNEETWQTEQQY